MIPSVAIKAYLSREVDDHTWVKDLDEEELWEAVRGLRPPPQLYDNMYKHQLACFLLGVAYPQFAFFVDMGGGKTLIALSLLQYWLRCGRIRRAVVLLKTDKAYSSWTRAFARFGIDLPYTLLDGSSAEKWSAYNEFGDGIIFVARPGLRAMLSKPARAKSGKTKWVMDKTKLDKFAEGLGALIQDESVDDANHTSLNHKIVEGLRVRGGVEINYALAGRPFGRDPTLLWGQMLLVDGGESLGVTLGLFRTAFFSAKPNFWGGPHSFDYTFKKKMMPELQRLAQHRSISYGEGECGDLPSVVPEVLEVGFSAEAAELFQQAAKAMRASRGNWRVIKNAFLRMRQLSSGFMGFKDDETGERAQVEFAENPKLELLLELLQDMPYDHKAVIFYEFTYSGRRIAEELAKLKQKAVWLWSGTANAQTALDQFMRDRATRFVVINNRLGAYSLDGLQEVANYLMVYESPVSAIDREQMERRLIRNGQPHTVFQYDLVVRGSADARILQFHKEGRDLMAAFREDPEVLFRR